MSNRNSEIKKAIDSFDTETARSLLREALKEANAETYYLASLVAIDNEQKRVFLQKSVDIDPFFEKSHEALKGYANTNLSGKSNSLENDLAQKSTQSAVISTNINQFITATTQGNSDNIPLYVIPIESGLIRTQLKRDTKVLLIERDERAEWFLCGYLSQIGQPIIGWLPFLNIKDINYLGNEINLLDLPITRFEPYNSRYEVQQLILGKKKKQNISTQTTASGIILLIFSILLFLIGFVALIFGFASLVDGTGTSFLLIIIAFVFGIGFIGLLIAGLSEFSKGKIQPSLPSNEEIKRLDMLQKNMRSEYERLRDDQRFTLGIQAGLDTAKNLIGIAGNAVASKILTTSNQPKDKKR